MPMWYHGALSRKKPVTLIHTSLQDCLIPRTACRDHAPGAVVDQAVGGQDPDEAGAAAACFGFTVREGHGIL